MSAPAGVSLAGLHVTLNGTDASSLFTYVSCETTCMTANLSLSGGARPGQNTLYASLKTSSGTVLSARYPFELASDAAAASSGVHAMGAWARAAATAPDGGSAFNPPTVYFQTLTPGGWQGSGSFWLQVGAQKYPSAGTPACSGIYFAVVLNRQTLAEQTSAPESSPRCFSNGTDLSAYLATLTSSDLAITGTTSENASDAKLNTSAIGGSDHSSDKHSPTGYMAIGGGGTMAGSGYENYATSGYIIQPWPRANGFLQQDTNGSYNFQPADAREIVVDPFSPVVNSSNNTSGSVVVEMTAADKASTNAVNDRFLIPDPSTLSPAQGLRGGYWLLILDRNTLAPTTLAAGTAGNPLTSLGTGTPAAGCGGTIQGTERVWTGCGTLYPTGDETSISIRKAAYDALAKDLGNLNPYFIGVLVSYGFPACCGSYFDIAYDADFVNFAAILDTLGASARVPLFTNNINMQVFTLITSSDMGSPLAGASVLSSTFNSDSSQTGYVHAIMVRNQRGLFQPSQPSQQVNAADDAAAGPDYTITKMTLSQPVDWPELSSTLLSGATTTAGQAAAYRWTSYQLVTQHYIAGASGSHLDDIHYYFTGSNANYLNYHYYDPRSLAFPGPSGQAYQWIDPVTNAALSFTQNDLSAVTPQIYAELVDFFDALNYLVTGPVNLKNAVASGDSSASSALTAAAATILGGALKPASTTPVNVNVSNVLSFIGGVASVAAGIASDGSFDIVDGVIANRINKGVSIIGGGFSTAAAVSGGFQSASTTNGSRFQAFATTIGQLAQSQLQEQYSVGFDLTADSILSDWNRLNTIGPLTTDSDNVTFFAPDQTSQVGAVTAMNLASERSYYVSLMPSLYTVQRWHGFPGVDTSNSANSSYSNQPAAGISPAFGQHYYPFYLTGSGASAAAPAYSFEWIPTPGQEVWPNHAIDTSCPVDVWVIASGKASPLGSNGAQFAFPSEDVLTRLFSQSGLAVPLDEFVAQHGPMQSVFMEMSDSATLHNATGFQVNQISDARSVAINFSCARGSVAVGDPGPPTLDTTTTLEAPATALLGQAFTLSANVTQGAMPVNGGSVYFLIDGTIANNVTVDSTGTATLSATPTLGQHTYQALYSVVAPYNPSESAVDTVVVYADSPDLSIALSQGALTVSYGVASAPVAITVSSMYGMTGTVQYSCSGLPVGMSCSFDSATSSLGANASATTNLRIVSQVIASAGFAYGNPLLAVFACGFALLLPPARGRLSMRTLVAVFLLGGAAFMTGCSQTSSSGASVQESGTKTVLVNATVGATTKSVPLVVTIQ